MVDADLILVLLILCIFVILYFLPTIIAFSSNRKNKVAIFVLNLLLGWTFFGWVGALVWAFMKD